MRKPTPITDEAFPASKGKPDAFEVLVPVGRLRAAEVERNAALLALRAGVAATGAAKPTSRALLRATAVMREAIQKLEGGAS